MNHHCKRAIDILNSAEGDNLERANAAFCRLTETELNRQYGQSGSTCREIWDSYKEHRREHREMVAHVRKILESAP